MTTLFIVHLRPLPGWPTPFRPIKPEQRIKALVKPALRNHGLRCEAVVNQTPGKEVAP